MNTDQLLPAIRRLADRYGLPDGLSLFEDPGWIWLAAFAAHVEAQAEEQDLLGLDDNGPNRHSWAVWWITEDDHGLESPWFYTPGDTLSRITARLLALDDGAAATAKG